MRCKFVFGIVLGSVLASASLFNSGCSSTSQVGDSGSDSSTGKGAEAPPEIVKVEGLDGLAGSVAIDGSSTVYPVTEAVAEEFQNATKQGVKITVGISGTGGGFKKFYRGETD